MRKRKFTDEQVAFIRNNLRIMSTRKVAEAYSEEFGEALGQTQLRRVCEQYGIQNPREENKPMPVGYEKWSDYYQCVIVKVKQVSVKGVKPSAERSALRQSQWQMKQNYVWEQANGKRLSPDMIVVFLDGDRTNYDPENLYATRLEVVGYAYRTKIASEHPKIMESALMCAELALELKRSGKNMVQYCRYCSHMCCGNGNYCSVKDRCYSDSVIRHTNHCKDFELNPIDAMSLNKTYQPRQKEAEKQYKQMTINDLE